MEAGKFWFENRYALGLSTFWMCVIRLYRLKAFKNRVFQFIKSVNPFSKRLLGHIFSLIQRNPAAKRNTRTLPQSGGFLPPFHLQKTQVFQAGRGKSSIETA